MGGGEMISMLVLWAVVIGLMWFLLMRPQKKNRREYRRCSHRWKWETPR